MSLKVAVQMDPLEGINIEGDTTFLMMQSAQERGHSLWVYTPERMALESGKLTAKGRAVTVQPVKGDHATFGPWETRDLSEFDVVLLRQDPPFDMAYITSTHFLDAIHPKTLVVNNPTEVRNAPEKLFVTTFPGVQPPTLITSDLEAIYEFRARQGDIVLKPLNGAGTYFWAITGSRLIMRCRSSMASRLGSSASRRATPEPPAPFRGLSTMSPCRARNS